MSAFHKAFVFSGLASVFRVSPVVYSQKLPKLPEPRQHPVADLNFQNAVQINLIASRSDNVETFS